MTPCIFRHSRTLCPFPTKILRLILKPKFSFKKLPASDFENPYSLKWVFFWGVKALITMKIKNETHFLPLVYMEKMLCAFTLLFYREKLTFQKIKKPEIMTRRHGCTNRGHRIFSGTEARGN